MERNRKKWKEPGKNLRNRKEWKETGKNGKNRERI